MVNIRDVAHAAGVSATTVSRFLNHDATLNIREETKERIIQTCKLMDYTQRDYRGKKIISSIGIISVSTHDEEGENPYFQLLLREIVRLTKKRKWGLNFMVSVGKLLSIWPAIGQVNAVVVIGHVDRVLLDAIYKVNQNTIVVEDYYCGEQFHRVSVDFYHEALGVLDRLKLMGHHDIAYIGGQNARTGLNGLVFEDGLGDRESAFRDWCALNSSPIMNRCFIGKSWDAETGYMQTQRLITQSATLPSCILVASDTMALGVLDCLRKSRLMVPRDISVCSFNNNQLSAWTDPALTTFHIDIPQIAYWVSIVCDKIIQKRFSPPIKIILSGDMILRDSLVPLN